jgi:hypothetical protein
VSRRGVSGIAVAALAVCLCFPAVAGANGDPASDYLLVQDVFLPFNAKIDPKASANLSATIRAADKSGFKVKVALIGSRYDLGTAFSLYNKAQRYSEFLGLEISFVFRGHLIVAMPNGFGASVKGKSDARGINALKALPAPGKDATKQVQAATIAVRRFAAAYGVHVAVSDSGGGGSQTRDRLTIAAAIVALLALLAGIVFIRKRPAPTTE